MGEGEENELSTGEPPEKRYMRENICPQKGKIKRD